MNAVAVQLGIVIDQSVPFAQVPCSDDQGGMPEVGRAERNALMYRLCIEPGSRSHEQHLRT